MIKFTEYIVLFSTSQFFNLLLGSQNDWFYWVYWDFLIFRPLAGRSTERFYWIYQILSTFRLFNLLPGGQNDWFYWLYLIFYTFRLFDILVGGQNDLFCWISCFSYFSTFRSLGGRYKWSLLQNIFNFFDFSTTCWEVKLIDLTGYIG